MNAKLWLLAAFAAACLIASHVYVYAASGPELDKMQQQMFSPTVQLNGNCSGVVIWSKRDEKSGEVSTFILTARHCVSNEKQDQTADVPVYHDNLLVKKERYIAKVHGLYFDADLGLFRLKDKQTLFENVAKLAPAMPGMKMGEDVWSVGYPLGWSLTVTEGLFGVIEVSDFDTPGREYYRATPDIAGGNSGGGLFRKNAAGDYELIGITTAGARGYPFIALYTPIYKIHDYLKVAIPEAVGEKPK
jgi:S1-C subfamily serine protease